MKPMFEYYCVSCDMEVVLPFPSQEICPNCRSRMLSQHEVHTGSGNTDYWLLAMLLVAFMFTTSIRNEIWKSEESIWLDVIAKAPAKARGWLNLGGYYMRNEQYPQAMDRYVKVAELHPEFGKTGVADYRAAALSNLGTILTVQNKLDDAEKVLRHILMKIDSADALVNLSSVLIRKGRSDLAVMEIDLRIQKPGYNQVMAVHFNRAEALKRLKRCDEANAEYDIAIKGDPTMPKVRCEL